MGGGSVRLEPSDPSWELALLLVTQPCEPRVWPESQFSCSVAVGQEALHCRGPLLTVGPTCKHSCLSDNVSLSPTTVTSACSNSTHTSGLYPTSSKKPSLMALINLGISSSSEPSLSLLSDTYGWHFFNENNFSPIKSGALLSTFTLAV